MCVPVSQRSSAKSEITGSMLIDTCPVNGMTNRVDQIWLIKRMKDLEFPTSEVS